MSDLLRDLLQAKLSIIIGNDSAAKALMPTIDDTFEQLVSERTRTLREALDAYNAAADKFLQKCADGRAHSRETQADLRAAREEARAILKDGQPAVPGEGLKGGKS